MNDRSEPPGRAARRSASIVDAEIALGTWRRSTSRGSVAQASFDEDAFTLSARAGLSVLERNRGRSPSTLIVATVSAPLPEPGIAPFLCEVFDMASPKSQSDVIELGGSVSSGVGGVALAAQHVSSGNGPVLFVAADDRRDAKKRPLGAGAVALLLAEDGDVADVAPLAGGSGLFLDRWQRRSEPGVRTGDRSLDRFGPGRAFADEIARGEVIFTSASGPSIERAGFPGVAAPLMHLLLSGLQSGASVTVVSSAGGISRAIDVEVGPGFEAVASRAAAELARGLDEDPGEPPDESEFLPYYSHPGAFRERAQTFRLEGSRGIDSEEILYPAPPNPPGSEREPYRLGRTGTVATFARDHVFPLGSPLTMAVVDLDGGGRFYGQVVDGLQVAIGDRIELVLRRLHDGGQIPNYFWKIQPASGRFG